MVAVNTHLPAGDAPEPQAGEAWLASIAPHYSTAEQQRLAAAYALALRLLPQHELETGETQLRRNLATADILAQLRLDVETLQVALLQGVLDTSQLESTLGRPVAQMVANIARLALFGELPALVAEKERHAHAEGLRRLLLGIAEDVRAVLVVLAGRLHLLRASKYLEDESRRRLARETQDLYAPLANRLGIWQIKWELEDMSLRFLEPEEYQRIAGLLDGRRADREDYINQVMTLLKGRFGEAGIRAQVTGRPKHIYSIWRKMSRKGVDFDQIFDVRAVRVLVETVANCYAALGIVHGLWRHIPGEFDDYIATPKTNMYQSIHTAVVGPEDKPLEIQIRTHEMHQHAELGVAAHWRYKESSGHDAELERRILWMRHWLELKEEGGEAEEFFNHFKAEFEPVQVYVLTPQNKVIELPKGATPLDFAYAIHSEVGHKCRGARVDGRLVSLTHSLESGQTVEILTAKNGTPSRDWLSPHLGYLHTARARNRVRQWFKQQDFDLHLADGRNLLDKELGRLGISERPELDKLASRLNYKRGNDLLAAIGRGDLSPIQVIGQANLRPPRPPEPERPPLSAAARAPRPSHSEVVVEGIGNLMTHMARCCKPVPYDDLMGFITLGRGVTVHRSNCLNLQRLSVTHQDRLIQVHWSDQSMVGSYPVDILVIAVDRKGLLRDISSVIANEDVDVIGVNTHSDRSNDTATMRFTVEISDIQQLSRVLNRVTQVPEVFEVRRQM